VIDPATAPAGTTPANAAIDAANKSTAAEVTASRLDDRGGRRQANQSAEDGAERNL
jgi:hypothetical protein